MPQYLIRQNINGRALGQVVERLASDSAAAMEGIHRQNRINVHWLEMTGRRGPCPKVEVLKLIWSGTPEESQTPSAIKWRAREAKKKLEMLDELRRLEKGSV